MYSNHNSLPSANEVFIQNNNVELPLLDNQENRRNDYTKYQDMRREGRYQPQKSDNKTFPGAPKSRAKSVNSGKKFLSVCENAKFPIFNSKLREDSEHGLVVNAVDHVRRTTGTLHNINWPTLTLVMKNKDSKRKKRSPPKFSHVAVQTENYNLKLIYPLWNTREIALPMKDDFPVFKENKVSRGPKIENYVSMKIQLSCRPEPSNEELVFFSTSGQNIKSCANVVQREQSKLDQECRPLNKITFPEKGKCLKIKGTRRSKITEFSKFRYFSALNIHSGNSGSNKQLSLKDKSIETNTASAGNRNEKSSAFSFEELVQCLTETRKTSKLKIDAEEKLGCSRMNTQNKYSHKGTLDGNSVQKTTTTFVHGGNKRSFCKQNSNNQLQKSHLLHSNKALQNFFQYPYYSCEQVISCAKAEFIATYGFDIENAINIAYYLWQRRKQRLPYTRMFTKSSVPYTNYEGEADFQTLQ